jgi:hypothetical protein
MPAAGRQLEPIASMRITNIKRRDVTVSSRLKKMPPRNGRKKRSIIAAEKPKRCRNASVVCSGAARRVSVGCSTANSRTSPTRTLSATPPICTSHTLMSRHGNSAKLMERCSGWRKGSATRWNATWTVEQRREGTRRGEHRVGWTQRHEAVQRVPQGVGDAVERALEAHVSACVERL